MFGIFISLRDYKNKIFLNNYSNGRFNKEKEVDY